MSARKTNVPRVAFDFQDFVVTQSRLPAGGSPHSWRRALELLSDVFAAEKPSFTNEYNVWNITDPNEIMHLHGIVKKEQNKLRRGEGLFLPYSSHCGSYYRNGWCSAALKLYAQFRATQKLDVRFDEVLNESSDGKNVAKKVASMDYGSMNWCVPDDIDPASKQGREVVRETKARIGQSEFRRWMLAIYSGQCCVSGLAVPELLRASHIVAWSDDDVNRLNPENGLCLSATYDAAFDRHLISFDEQYRMMLSDRIKDYCTNAVHNEYFKRHEGRKINLPVRFLPSQSFLQRHRELTFAK